MRSLFRKITNINFQETIKNYFDKATSLLKNKKKENVNA